MNPITKYPKRFDVDAQILMYWLMYVRAPGRETPPGEAVDLQEIGTVPEKSWSRDTPYSVAQPR